MNWIIQNWNNILTVSSAVLALGVAVSHSMHKEDVASKLSDLQATIIDLQKR